MKSPSNQLAPAYDDAATVIDDQLPWSLRRPSAQGIQPSPALPRRDRAARTQAPATVLPVPRVTHAPRTVIPVPPLAFVPPAAPLVPRVTHAPPPVPVRMSAATAQSSAMLGSTPTAPRVAVPPPLPPMRARQHQDTERVSPLPMSAIQSPWTTLANLWQRFAAPACGLIAGLIFVVGYLAYSTQPGAVATAAVPVHPIVMPVVAMATPPAIEEAVEPVAPAAAPNEAAPAEADPIVAPPVAKAIPATRAPGKRIAPKKHVTASVGTSKRRPIRLDTSTALGALRPTRSF